MALARTLAWVGQKLVLIVLLATTLPFGLVAGCTKPAPTPSPVTIRFAFCEDDEHYYQAMADEFTKEQGIHVELIPTPADKVDSLGPDEADALFTYDIQGRY